MRRYRLDLKELAHPEADPHAAVGTLLREYLGGDPLAAARRRAQRDPQRRPMPAAAAAALRDHGERARLKGATS